MNFAVCFSPEAKHKQRAQSLLTMNAVIGNCFYPNPYTVVTNEDVLRDSRSTLEREKT